MTNEIDFLPVTYLEAGVHRKNFTLRMGMIWCVCGVVVLRDVVPTAFAPAGRSAACRINPQYERAVADSKQLSDLQTRVKTAEKQAELYAYLQHPWPRSRIICRLERIVAG